MVSASFAYDRSEYLRAFRRYRWMTLGTRRDCILGVAAVAGGIFLLYTGNPVFAGIALLAGLSMLAMVTFAIAVQPAMIYDRHATLGDDYRLEFSDAGIAFRTHSVDSTIKWSLYSTWLHDHEFFMLFYGTRELLIVPKRAMAKGDEAMLEDLLVKHIGSPHARPT